MALNAETVTEINRRAQNIVDEKAKRISKVERAWSRHEARKAKIRQELTGLNQQLAGDPQLKRNLSEILRAKDGYQTYREVDQMGLCIGLPISRTSSQIALMTEEGIQVLETHSRAEYNRSFGHYQVECFTPLKLEEADVDGLFPKTQFGVDQLADNIAGIILQSPNKK